MDKTANQAAAAKCAQVLQLMAALRNPETGCPWCLAQDFRSLAPYAIEEAYETADACARQNRADLCEELGDLLLQVLFHARIAEEEGSFCFADVAEALSAKLVRRNPHVFGSQAAHSAKTADAAAAQRQWAAIKAGEQAAKMPAEKEQQPPSCLDSVSAKMPAATEAVKLQEKAGQSGFDWADPLPVLAKLKEETAELEDALAAAKPAEIAEKYGDILFTALNLGRQLNANFEMSLRAANLKFRRRFGSIEQALRKQGKSLGAADLEEMEALWQKAKQAENKSR